MAIRTDPPPRGEPLAAPSAASAGAGRARVEAWNGAQLWNALRAGSAWLDAHVAQVNALNVFPVPDGDTGTNMSLTMRAALDEVGQEPPASAAEVARRVAHGALMGARGNSGVIFSQIMRGFARALDNIESCKSTDLAVALREGAVTAYKGVLKPVEGTILTVVREAADAANQTAASGGSVEMVWASAVATARETLARTPTLLPVLAEAGVVDAGGQGLLLILEGILRHIRGEEVREAASVTAMVEHVHVPAGGYNFDTQFILQGSALDVDAIRDHIATLGDSVLVVGDANTVKVHVHCDSPGQALDYGISLGQVSAIIIDNMQQQYQEFRAAAAPVLTPPPSMPPVSLTTNAPLGEIGVIAVVAGEGLARVFESLGISAVVPGGQTMNPSTQDLLNAINQVPSKEVILLPNNSNIILTASQAKELTSKEVAVVPTRTIPQGIAALLALNYQADLPANAAFMEEASRQVRTVEITRAVRSAQLNGLAIAEGQIIGLLNDQLTAAGAEMLSVVEDLLTRAAAAESEIITIYYGANVPLEEADALAAHVRALYPALTVEVFDGGQPHYYYIISIE